MASCYEDGCFPLPWLLVLVALCDDEFAVRDCGVYVERRTVQKVVLEATLPLFVTKIHEPERCANMLTMEPAKR